MNQKPQQPQGAHEPATSRLSRRTVFAGAGAVGALAAVAAVAPRTQEAAAPKVADGAGPQEGGYQLTEHVRRYYQTARV